MKYNSDGAFACSMCIMSFLRWNCTTMGRSKDKKHNILLRNIVGSDNMATATRKNTFFSLDLGTFSGGT